MTTAAYTPEMRERNARIAVAMGTHGYFISPAGLIYCIELPAHDALDVGYTRANDPHQVDVVGLGVPEFHASEDARRALLEWLAADDERWWEFDNAFFRLFPPPAREEGYPDYTRSAFLATPEQVARAADNVIREGEK